MQLRVWKHIISCQGGAEIGDKKAHHPEFQLIQGGHQFEMSSGPYAIIAAPTTKPPFPIDAVVEEVGGSPLKEMVYYEVTRLKDQ